MTLNQNQSNGHDREQDHHDPEIPFQFAGAILALHCATA